MNKDHLSVLLIPVLVIIVGLSALVCFGVWDWSTKINTGQIFEIIVLAVLVIATIFYAKRTSEIAEATKEQAKEIREQRVMASRPVIIQKAVYKEIGLTDDEIQWIGIERSAGSYFSHFEVYNAGNGPAIEVEISLLNKEKILIANEEMKPISWRESFLRASDPAIKFRPSNIANLEESITYYLVCEYQSILSRETWYQTWLAFEPAKSSKEDEIFIVAGELEFKEATEKERIDAFSRRSKPK